MDITFVEKVELTTYKLKGVAQDVKLIKRREGSLCGSS